MKLISEQLKVSNQRNEDNKIYKFDYMFTELKLI
jgi:hypothetical protein